MLAIINFVYLTTLGFFELPTLINKPSYESSKWNVLFNLSSLAASFSQRFSSSTWVYWNSSAVRIACNSSNKPYIQVLKAICMQGMRSAWYTLFAHVVNNLYLLTRFNYVLLLCVSTMRPRPSRIINFIWPYRFFLKIVMCRHTPTGSIAVANPPTVFRDSH